ncbi:5-methylcytosine restriction system component-like protein [Caldicellulosiruptor obsidiansis OB47]|uniref:5-methylcytosine restriction system component-like protein n=1 Tax=Caldicellulosiruptor obsidiansis (strain ATCC BAA-2073 / JCM 16842 / OB47) TaxID=608506 RepID=D9TH60_CALOO|nr:5-methylcytosine restriction system component-like protein [Caldicellulosiruptor obsidiansis OB47]
MFADRYIFRLCDYTVYNLNNNEDIKLKIFNKENTYEIYDERLKNNEDNSENKDNYLSKEDVEKINIGLILQKLNEAIAQNSISNCILKVKNKENNEQKNQQLNRFEQESKNVLFKFENGQLQTYGYIGAIRLKIAFKEVEQDLIQNQRSNKNEAKNTDKTKGNVREIYVLFEICSRFDKIKKQYFLIYLLSKCFKNLKNFYENKIKIGVSDVDLWNLLMVLKFKIEIEEAYRQGLYRTYRNFENNNFNFRGKLDEARFIKYNIPFLGKIAYNVRERTYDNYLLHLVLHTYYRVRNRYREIVDNIINSQTLAYKAIRQMEELTPTFANSKLTEVLKNCSKKIVHPYYRAYEKIRITCLQILENCGISIFDSSINDSFQAIFIDVSELWEFFVYEILKEAFENNNGKDNIRIEYQKTEKVLSIDGSEKEKWEIAPDYILQKEEEIICVLDAKYKPAWADFVYSGNAKDKIRDDLYQIIAYIQFLDLTKGGIIFPVESRNETDCNIYSYHLSRLAFEKYFFAAGLKIPYYTGEQSMKLWVQKIEDNIKEIIEDIKNFLTDITPKNSFNSKQ